jgi:hypothetical protein
MVGTEQYHPLFSAAPNVDAQGPLTFDTSSVLGIEGSGVTAWEVHPQPHALNPDPSTLNQWEVNPQPLINPTS